MIDEPDSVTTWPGVQVPIPELPRYPDAELDGEFLYLGDRWELAPAPLELHLRQAAQLDVNDPGAAVLDIARNVGGLFTPQDLIGDPADTARDIAGAHVVREQFSTKHGRGYERVQPDPDRRWKVHVDEIAYRLRVLAVLGRHAVAHQRNDYLVPVWVDAVNGYPPQSERQCWSLFTSHMNAALSVFHVRVIASFGTKHNLGEEGATFLEAGALGIVNEMTREAEYLVCPNCGTTFARQIGGSTQFSRTTGVTFCSPRCATNARVRAYRARKRAEKES